MLRQLMLVLPLCSAIALAQAAPLPAPLAVLESSGVTVVRALESDIGLQGYLLEADGELHTAWLTPDQKHVIVGTALNAQGQASAGEDIAREEAQRAGKAWPLLEQALVIQDGRTSAPRVIYTFTDPNCVYCHRLWEVARPWVDAGRVQLRHVMVGMLRADSQSKAVALLSAADPAAALADHNRRFDQGGVRPAPQANEALQARIRANSQLMQQLNIRGTPASYYKDARGQVVYVGGMPTGEALEAMMGGPRP